MLRKTIIFLVTLSDLSQNARPRRSFKLGGGIGGGVCFLWWVFISKEMHIPAAVRYGGLEQPETVVLLTKLSLPFSLGWFKISSQSDVLPKRPFLGTTWSLPKKDPAKSPPARVFKSLSSLYFWQKHVVHWLLHHFWLKGRGYLCQSWQSLIHPITFGFIRGCAWAVTVEQLLCGRVLPHFTPTPATR